MGGAVYAGCRVSTLAPAAVVDAWLAAAEEALREVAKTALACADVSAATSVAAAPANLGGAYVQLMSEREVVVVGLGAGDAALRHVSGALLGAPGVELALADVTDAVGEVANMLAGGVKRRMSAANPGLQLGLPLFIQGHVQPRERQALRVSQMRLSPDIAVFIVVLHEPR